MKQVQTQHYNGHNIATAFHDAHSNKVVIFCHGYRGTSVGPSRLFVQAARKLAANGISSLRFDQYCSGNSDGDFINSSFNDWVATTTKIAEDYLSRGYETALFGQSMGAATVICVSSAITNIVANVDGYQTQMLSSLRRRKMASLKRAGNEYTLHTGKRHTT